jgi:hypothetical protein
MSVIAGPRNHADDTVAKPVAGAHDPGPDSGFAVHCTRMPLLLYWTLVQ